MDNTDSSSDNAHSLVRRYFDEVINQNKRELIEELFSPDVVVLSNGFGQHVGQAAIRTFRVLFHTAFPDCVVTIRDLQTMGSTILCAWTAHGTHLGDMFGHPATGQEVIFASITYFQVRDNRICELVLSSNFLQQIKDQLGIDGGS